jgi:pimeloyl-ACP methyl ester carboxylesterase
MRSAGCALLRLIGPSFLVSHSFGAVHSILLSDQCPELVVGNVNVEPASIPFQSYIGNATSSVGRTANRPWGLTNTAITYDPPAASPSDLKTVTVGDDTPGLRSCILQVEPAKKLINIAKVPYVALTGEASPHITYDHCVINYLRQCGVKADFIKLGEIGIRGNGHFSFLEKNNLEIAAVAEKWIARISKRYK